MANTYTKLYIHIVFAVQNRISVIKDSWKDELYKYITGITQNNGHKLLAINGAKDHVHILIGMKPVQALSELVKHIKGDSSRWINEKHLVSGKFSWQAGFGAFSHSASQIDNVVKYIMNQEEHHKQKSFKEEYLAFLKKFNVDYDERYIFNDVD